MRLMIVEMAFFVYGEIERQQAHTSTDLGILFHFHSFIIFTNMENYISLFSFFLFTSETKRHNHSLTHKRTELINSPFEYKKFHDYSLN